mmetsp:Transcript_130635/g.325987  ORF Transcript_130635/g.325987 Transcript_130635/m.325987 type:complete len:277 (-) Transcript_130635:172-1002(-)
MTRRAGYKVPAVARRHSAPSQCHAKVVLQPNARARLAAEAVYQPRPVKRMFVPYLYPEVLPAVAGDLHTSAPVVLTLAKKAWEIEEMEGIAAGTRGTQTSGSTLRTHGSIAFGARANTPVVIYQPRVTTQNHDAHSCSPTHVAPSCTRKLCATAVPVSMAPHFLHEEEEDGTSTMIGSEPVDGDDDSDGNGESCSTVAPASVVSAARNQLLDFVDICTKLECAKAVLEELDAHKAPYPLLHGLELRKQIWKGLPELMRRLHRLASEPREEASKPRT